MGDRLTRTTTNPPNTSLCFVNRSSVSLAPHTLSPLSIAASPLMEQPKKFTAEEVSQHTSKTDCWLTISGKVYDVTSFLEDHPGGEDALLHAAGEGDATQAFEDVGHSATAKRMMNTYLIGALDGYVSPKKPEAGNSRSTAASAKPAAGVVDFIMPLLILAVALSAWYYLTYMNKA